MSSFIIINSIRNSFNNPSNVCQTTNTSTLGSITNYNGNFYTVSGTNGTISGYSLYDQSSTLTTYKNATSPDNQFYFYGSSSTIITSFSVTSSSGSGYNYTINVSNGPSINIPNGFLYLEGFQTSNGTFTSPDGSEIPPTLMIGNIRNSITYSSGVCQTTNISTLGSITNYNGTFYTASGSTGTITGFCSYDQSFILNMYKSAVPPTNEFYFYGSSTTTITSFSISSSGSGYNYTIYVSDGPTSNIANGFLFLEGFIAPSTGTQTVTNVEYGFEPTATGGFTYNEGFETIANGDFSYAEGYDTTTNGNYSHAEGSQTTSSGDYSHSEGFVSNSVGLYSHSEGQSTMTYGIASHAEGYETSTGSAYTHSQGYKTQAGYFGIYNYSEDITFYTYNTSYGTIQGTPTITTDPITSEEINIDYYLTYCIENSIGQNLDDYNFLIQSYSYDVDTGLYTLNISGTIPSTNMDSGVFTIYIPNLNISSHSEGYETQALGFGSHAEGSNTITIGDYSHAEGYDTITLSLGSHAEGYSTTTNGYYSHSMGNTTNAVGNASLAEGNLSVAYADYSHSEGYETQSGTYIFTSLVLTGFGNSNATIYNFTYTGTENVTNGLLYIPAQNLLPPQFFQLDNFTFYNGYASIYTTSGSIPSDTYANCVIYGQLTGKDYNSGIGSHVEGDLTMSIGNYSHAEGYNTYSIGTASHTMGYETIAIGLNSSALGSTCINYGDNSYIWADGEISRSNNSNQTYNVYAREIDLFSYGTSDTGTQTINITSNASITGTYPDSGAINIIASAGSINVMGTSGVNIVDGGSILVQNNGNDTSTAIQLVTSESTGGITMTPGSGGYVTFYGNVSVSGTLTSNTFEPSDIIITGGTISNTSIGTSSVPAGGTFSTLSNFPIDTLVAPVTLSGSNAHILEVKDNSSTICLNANTSTNVLSSYNSTLNNGNGAGNIPTITIQPVSDGEILNVKDYSGTNCLNIDSSTSTTTFNILNVSGNSTLGDTNTNVIQTYKIVTNNQTVETLTLNSNSSSSALNTISTSPENTDLLLQPNGTGNTYINSTDQIIPGITNLYSQMDYLSSLTSTYTTTSLINAGTPISIALSASGTWIVLGENGNPSNYYFYNGTYSSGLTPTTTTGSTYVAISYNGQYQSYVVNGVDIVISPNYGSNSSTYGTSDTYQAISMNSTGQYQTVGTESGLVYVSTDYGSTFTSTNLGSALIAIAVSGIGLYQIAVMTSGSAYISSNYGSLFSRVYDVSFPNVSDVAISHSGQYMSITAADSTNTGYIYISSNYGSSWQTSGSSELWTGISMTSNGAIQVACTYNSYVFVSYNYGSSFSLLVTIGSVNLTAIAISASGYSMIVGSSNYIYTFDTPITCGNMSTVNSSINNLTVTGSGTLPSTVTFGSSSTGANLTLSGGGSSTLSMTNATSNTISNTGSLTINNTGHPITLESTSNNLTISSTSSSSGNATILVQCARLGQITLDATTVNLTSPVVIGANTNITTSENINFNVSNSSGTFKTTTGGFYIATNSVVNPASSVSITSAGGSASLDLSSGSGNLKTPTGSNNINCPLYLSTNCSISCSSSSTGTFDFSNSSGSFNTPTGGFTISENLNISPASGTVTIGGSSISSSSAINNVTIGSVVPSTGSFTTINTDSLTMSGTATVVLGSTSTSGLYQYYYYSPSSATGESIYITSANNVTGAITITTANGGINFTASTNGTPVYFYGNLNSTSTITNNSIGGTTPGSAIFSSLSVQTGTVSLGGSSGNISTNSSNTTSGTITFTATSTASNALVLNSTGTTSLADSIYLTANSSSSSAILIGNSSYGTTIEFESTGMISMNCSTALSAINVNSSTITNNSSNAWTISGTPMLISTQGTGNISLTSTSATNYATTITTSAGGILATSATTNYINTSQLVINGSTSITGTSTNGDVVIIPAGNTYINSTNGIAQGKFNVYATTEFINDINFCSWVNGPGSTTTNNSSGTASWTSVAMSYNGQYQYATNSSSTTPTSFSQNYGYIWTTLSSTVCPATKPACVAMSATGQYAVIGDGSSGTGKLYMNCNYSTYNWVAITLPSGSSPTNSGFTSIAMSANGQIIVAACAGSNGIYISTNGTTSTTLGSNNLYETPNPTFTYNGLIVAVIGVAMTMNGNTILAVSSSGYIYTITTNSSSALFTSPNTSWQPNTLCMSQDGQYIACSTTYTAGSAGVWVSNNYGASGSWTLVTHVNAGTTIYGASGLSMSGCGKYIIGGNTLNTTGEYQVFVSNTYGSYFHNINYESIVGTPYFAYSSNAYIATIAISSSYIYTIRNTMTISNGNFYKSISDAYPTTFQTGGTNDLYIQAGISSSSIGVYLTPTGTSWTSNSSRELKEVIDYEIDHEANLEKLDKIPIDRWAYKEDKYNHEYIGPYVEDIEEQFEGMTDGVGLSTLQLDSIIYTCLKGAYSKHKVLENEFDLEFDNEFDEDYEELCALRRIYSEQEVIINKQNERFNNMKGQIDKLRNLISV